jgi:hypothetical protein
MFCTPLCYLGSPRVLFGGLLLSLEGARFPLVGAPLRCRFATFGSLLGCLCMLRGFGLTFRFFVQRTLACGFAGRGC